jgi:hypothetical protein
LVHTVNVNALAFTIDADDSTGLALISTGDDLYEVSSLDIHGLCPIVVLVEITTEWWRPWATSAALNSHSHND